VQDPLEAAGPHLQTLKKAGVDVVVALTHLTFAEDRALADRYPEIDVIVGGHEHYPITAVHNRTLISKAGTEARFVARIDINRRNGGPLERFYELIPMNAAISEDPATAAVAKSYEDRMGAELEIPIARTRVALDGITARLRTSETNLGNLVADAIRTEASADVAIVNAGGIRGDRLHAPGPLTRRLLLEIHPFGNVVCKIAVPGRVILNALNHGVAELPLASGQFPQVSGLTMRVDMTAVPGSRVSDVRIVGQPLDLNRIYTVALPDYLLLGGDSYKLFAGQRVLIAAEDGTRVTTALESYVMARGEIAPAVERRIIIEP
jgi:5'-nucleotidase